MRLVETTVSINEQRKRGMARKVIAACGGSVHGKKIGLLGLTFKPDTDDVREASSLAIIRALQDAGAKVQAFDPQGMESARSLVEDVTFGADSYAAAAGASALVLVTEWTAFHALDFVRLRDAMDDPVLVDLRNFYAPREMARHGFRYVGVGRPADADEPWIAVAAE
jgi:UDPglucose 6-dehydrogenase